MISRRQMLIAGAATAAVGSLEARGQTAPATTRAADPALGEASYHRTIAVDEDVPPGEPGRDYRPVFTPNNETLPYTLVDGVKVMHLVAHEFEHEFAPGLRCKVWGYNGHCPGPTIEVCEGDRVRIYVTNRLPAATTIHWHGAIVPSGMDGVGGLSHEPIPPGETFKYEFRLIQHGTLMYHSHHDEMTQMGMGLVGMFVVHPRRPIEPLPDRDFAIMLGEWAIPVGASRPNPNEMTDFNVLTMNAKAFPGTQSLNIQTGQRVRIRMGNLSAMDHHPIHIHGYNFLVTQTDGGVIPPGARHPETMLFVPVGSTRTLEFDAIYPGDWAFHCHMSHHVMNQMGHNAANVVGANIPRDLSKRISGAVPGYMTMGTEGMAEMGDMGMTTPRNSIPMVGGEAGYGYVTMGGMFTVIKVRDQPVAYEADAGWYKNPPGTQAVAATADELRRDGVNVDRTA